MDFIFLYIAATVVLGFWILQQFKRCGKGHPPVVGTVLDYIINFKRLHDYHADQARRYRTYTVAYPSTNYVYTTDPANVEHMLRRNFSNYVKGKINHDIMGDLLGDGIFTVDGDKWRQQRKLASFEFSTKVLRDFSSVVFRETAMTLANVLAQHIDQHGNGTVEMQDLLMRTTMDSICKVAFGVEMKSLSSTNSVSGREETLFAEAFDGASSLAMWRYVDCFWKLKKVLNIRSEALMREHIKTVDAFVYKVIRNRRLKIDSAGDIDHMKPDILTRFIALSQREPQEISDKYLRDVILNFMIAGRDTTAGTLSWWLCLLCKHPQVEDKLVQEINDVVGQIECASFTESVTCFAQCLTNGALDKMHYLHASLSETLRLYPAVPMDGKCIQRDDTLPDGFKVRKGDVLSYHPYAMGRMKYIWGDDAEEFRPDRWLHNGVFQPQSPFKFTAFQAGARICLGKDFAYIQMKIVGAILLRFFKFEAVNSEVKYRIMLTLHMSEDGLNLRVYPRSNG